MREGVAAGPDMKFRFTCPVHGTVEVGCHEIVIDVFDVYLRCRSECVITKKVNPIVARRLRANGAQEVAAALARDARDYLERENERRPADRQAGIEDGR
jgi:hypothetical protein